MKLGQERKKQLQSAYGGLYDEVLHILHDHDPVGIGYIPDEYEPEVGTILPRLKEAHSPEQTTAMVHEEFVRWFSAEIAEAQSKYEAIGREIWAAYERFLQTTQANATD
jgi:hypothetical protein